MPTRRHNWMVITVIGVAIFLLQPTGEKTKDQLEPIESSHKPAAPLIPAPPELEEAYELAIPGHARIRCPAPTGVGDHIGLRAKSTGRYKGSSLRWIDIRDGHLNGATTDSSGEVLVYAGTVPLGIIRWSKPSPGVWTHCSMVGVELIERDGVVVSQERGLPVAGATVSLCGYKTTTTDANGRFKIPIPKHGDCEIRTFEAVNGRLYLGTKWTLKSKDRPRKKPLKLRQHGTTDNLSLAELERLSQGRLAHLKQQQQATTQYRPIHTALELPELANSTRTVLQSWVDAEAQQTIVYQLTRLVTNASTLNDYQDAFLSGPLSDL